MRRGSAVTADELLTPAGARATSTAERLLGLVEQASAARMAFDQVSAMLLAKVPDANRTAAEALVQQGQKLGDGFLSEFTMDTYLTELRDYLRQLHLLVPPKARQVQGEALAALAIGGPAVGLEAPAGGARAASSPPVIVDAAVTASAVAAAAIALMVIAVGSVLAAQYLPNQTFGTWTDYFGLAVAAFGSSSVVGVLALLVLLRGPQAWYA